MAGQEAPQVRTVYLSASKSHQRRAAALSCLLSNFRTDCGERGKVLETITGLEVLRKRAVATHERLNEVRSYRTTLAEELDRITRAEELNERQRQIEIPSRHSNVSMANS